MSQRLDYCLPMMPRIGPVGHRQAETTKALATAYTFTNPPTYLTGTGDAIQIRTHVPEATTITDILFFVRTTDGGSPGTIIVEIRDTDTTTNRPGSTLHCSTTTSPGTVTDKWVKATFSSPATFTAGQQISIVIGAGTGDYTVVKVGIGPFYQLHWGVNETATGFNANPSAEVQNGMCPFVMVLGNGHRYGNGFTNRTITPYSHLRKRGLVMSNLTCDWVITGLTLDRNSSTTGSHDGAGVKSIAIYDFDEPPNGTPLVTKTFDDYQGFCPTFLFDEPYTLQSGSSYRLVIESFRSGLTTSDVPAVAYVENESSTYFTADILPTLLAQGDWYECCANATNTAWTDSTHKLPYINPLLTRMPGGGTDTGDSQKLSRAWGVDTFWGIRDIDATTHTQALTNAYTYSQTAGAGNAAAWVFAAPVTDSIANIYFYRTVAGTSSVTFELRLLDGNDQSPGTLVGTQTFSPGGSSNTWYKLVLTTPLAITRGKAYCIVVGRNGAGGTTHTFKLDAQGPDRYQHTMFTMTTADGFNTTTTVRVSNPCCVVETVAGNVFGGPQTGYATNYYSGTVERGWKITGLTEDLKVAGIKFAGTGIANVSGIKIYAAATAPGGTTLHSSAFSSGCGKEGVLWLSNPYTLEAGTDYRLVVTVGASINGPDVFKLEDTGTYGSTLRACWWMQGGWYSCYDNGAGGWTDDQDVIPFIALILDEGLPGTTTPGDGDCCENFAKLVVSPNGEVSIEDYAATHTDLCVHVFFDLEDLEVVPRQISLPS